MFEKHLITAAVAAVTLVSPVAALAAEYPAGDPVIAAGMEIGAVYLQPITMDPPGMKSAAETDVHLEADIHALEDNANGFALGDWIPYLNIHFKLEKQGGATIEGMFIPMVASDGPHYGANVKMDGEGAYHLTYTITHPGPEFGRHVDKETGVAPWFEPIVAEYDFVYAGVGKKGSY